MLTDPLPLLSLLAGLLDRLGIRYCVGGSLASSHHGEPRATNDLDVLVELSEAQTSALVRSLAPDFHVFEDTAWAAVRAGRSFSAVHFGWLTKVDFYPAGDALLDRAQLSRRVSVPTVSGQTLWFASAEDIVLRKLDWFRRSGGHLERQLRDVTGVMKQQRGRLDVAYLREMAAELGLSATLESCLSESGIA